MEKTITREQHLDHLSRVVPLLALAYGVQSYLLMYYAKGPSGHMGQFILLTGIFLAASVLALVTYDLKHQITLAEDCFIESWKGASWQRKVGYHDIQHIELHGDTQTFYTLVLTLNNKRRLTYYFIDKGEEVKAYLESKRAPQPSISRAA